MTDAWSGDNSWIKAHWISTSPDTAPEYLFSFEVTLVEQLCRTVCAKETHVQLAYNLSVKLGWFIEIAVLFVFQLFICQWRRTRSDKTKLQGAISPAREVSHYVYCSCSGSKDCHQFNTGHSTKSPERHVTSSSLCTQPFIIPKYVAWAHGGNDNGGWQEEIGNCWGGRPPALLACWACWATQPLQTSGGESLPGSADAGLPSPPRGSFSWLAPASSVVLLSNMSPFSLKLVEDTAMLIFLKNTVLFGGISALNWSSLEIKGLGD